MIISAGEEVMGDCKHEVLYEPYPPCGLLSCSHCAESIVPLDHIAELKAKLSAYGGGGTVTYWMDGQHTHCVYFAGTEMTACRQRISTEPRSTTGEEVMRSVNVMNTEGRLLPRTV